MTRMRMRTAERLKDSQNTAAMLTTFNEIDMRFVCGNMRLRSSCLRARLCVCVCVCVCVFLLLRCLCLLSLC
jgi:hypothetical protein